MTSTNAAKILMVEDNPDDCEMILRALRQLNLADQVRVAQDGAEALDYIFCIGLHQNRRIENRPRIVLLDLKLPKVDGLEVIHRLKGDPRTKAIPVVVFTSSQEPRDITESYALGVNSYVVKPVNFEGFATAVQELGRYWLFLNQSPKA